MSWKSKCLTSSKLLITEVFSTVGSTFLFKEVASSISYALLDSINSSIFTREQQFPRYLKDDVEQKEAFWTKFTVDNASVALELVSRPLEKTRRDS